MKNRWFNQIGPVRNTGNTGTSQAALVACNSCNNGSPVGIGMFPVGQCPAGSSTSNNPCPPPPPPAGMVTCERCDNGSPVSTQIAEGACWGNAPNCCPYTINGVSGWKKPIPAGPCSEQDCYNCQTGEVQRRVYGTCSDMWNTPGNSGAQLQITSVANGVSNVPCPQGCTDASYPNYNPNVFFDDGSCAYPPPPPSITCYACSNGQPLGSSYINMSTCPQGETTDPNLACAVYGCTNPIATNFNPAATIDDGSCTLPPPPPSITCYACSNGQPLGSSYINMSTCPQGETTDPNLACAVYGCTNPTAQNYNPAANIDDGSCMNNPLPIAGCTDPIAQNYNPSANYDDGSCIFPPTIIYGCTNPSSPNYNWAANIDDGTCLNNPTLPPLPIIGCMDPNSITYNPLAVTTPISGLDINGNPVCQYGDPIDPITFGCTNPTATNYDAMASDDDGSCIITSSPLLGCTNPGATNYNPLANTEDGSCLMAPSPVIIPTPTPVPTRLGGCMDAKATNYNPAATFTNNTCIYPPVKGLEPEVKPIENTTTLSPLVKQDIKTAGETNNKMLMYLAIGAVAIILLKK